jgi:hypothetical protein
MQTATEINQIAIEFKKHAPRGFILDANNGGQIQAYLAAKGKPITIETISAAIEALKYSLDWEQGFAPVPVAPVGDSRSQRQKAVDGGIRPYEPTGYVDAANGIESSWTKEIRSGQAANAARLAAKAKADLRFRETHQVVQGPNGRISYSQSEAANKAASLRHAQEDFLEPGRPVTVATGPRSIPRDENDPNYQAWLRTASADEIKIYLSRKNRSHLMR